MKSTDRKNWEKEQRKNRIVDIAQEIFFSKGFENSTMEEIARAAGYNKRTIYLYFKDKEDLFLAVVLRGQEILLEKLEQAFNNFIENRDLIRELGRAFFSFSLEYPEYFNLIMIYESRSGAYFGEETEGVADDFKTQCMIASDKYGEFVTRAITIGIEKKIIGSTLTPKQLMLILWGQVFGVMQIILMRKQHFEDVYEITPEELFDHFMNLTDRALSVRG